MHFAIVVEGSYQFVPRGTALWFEGRKVYKWFKLLTKNARFEETTSLKYGWIRLMKFVILIISISHVRRAPCHIL